MSATARRTPGRLHAVLRTDGYPISVGEDLKVEEGLRAEHDRRFPAHGPHRVVTYVAASLDAHAECDPSRCLHAPPALVLPTTGCPGGTP